MTSCSDIVQDKENESEKHVTQIMSQIGDTGTRIKVGLELRQSWFINAFFLNSEAWHNVLKKDMDPIISLDKYLLRQIVGAHSKVAIEYLYLETATIPPDYILASRRVNYLHNIISRSDSELVKCVFNVQKENPSKGDWCDMVKQDMALINLSMSEKRNLLNIQKESLKPL